MLHWLLSQKFTCTSTQSLLVRESNIKEVRRQQNLSKLEDGYKFGGDHNDAICGIHQYLE